VTVTETGKKREILDSFNKQEISPGDLIEFDYRPLFPPGCDRRVVGYLSDGTSRRYIRVGNHLDNSIFYDIFYILGKKMFRGVRHAKRYRTNRIDNLKSYK
ncbi:MAG: hypothetical protein JSV63_02105, partial [Candidatus Aenigmatarchaeota archaeon]